MFRLSRSHVARVQPARLFSTTSAPRKSIVDSAKDAVKGVDRTVSDALGKGIDKTAAAAEAAKSTMSNQAGETSSEASAKMNEVKGQASELTGEAKGKASEVAGQVKGKTSEMAGEAKSKM